MQLRSLGSSALNLRSHHLAIGVHAPFASSALPRRSLASVASSRPLLCRRFRFPCRASSCCLRSASLPEVLCPSSGHVAHLPHAASHRNMLALLRRTSNTSRVLSPSSRPCIDTCQACSIPAPLMGFCLQRSVHILSRTPFGSPCPAFPWPRWRPFGLESFDLGLSALAWNSSVLRPSLACSRLPMACPLLRATVPPHGFADREFAPGV